MENSYSFDKKKRKKCPISRLQHIPPESPLCVLKHLASPQHITFSPLVYFFVTLFSFTASVYGLLVVFSGLSLPHPRYTHRWFMSSPQPPHPNHTSLIKESKLRTSEEQTAAMTSVNTTGKEQKGFLVILSVTLDCQECASESVTPVTDTI